MDFQLDRLIDRWGTQSDKWDGSGAPYDVVCSGTADMDFQVAPCILDAMRAQVDFGVFGYTMMTDEDWQAVMDWRATVHRQPLRREWLLYSPGVIPTLHAAIQAMTRPGDPVIIETPVYPPFFGAIKGEERTVVENPLRFADGRWQRDWEGLEDKFRRGMKLFFLCSPHNPTGRVWTAEEQARLAALCVKYDVNVLTDEIHSDIILPGNVHTPIAMLPGMETRTVTAISATKTFNLAGLQCSTVICPREDWRKTIADRLYRYGCGRPNMQAKVAQTAAYRSGRPWLEAVIAYVDGNLKALHAALNENGFPAAMPEGTYLIWADAARLSKGGKALIDYMVEKGRFHANDGTAFGEATWFRLNAAAPRARIDQIIEGLKKL